MVLFIFKSAAHKQTAKMRADNNYPDIFLQKRILLMFTTYLSFKMRSN